MVSLQRRLLFGLLVLAGMAVALGDTRAQDKEKDDKVLKTILTNDGLQLYCLWYPAVAKDKATPDGVIMFPKPGGKVDKNWVALAEAMQAKGFSVLLFDWRGCGMNGPELKAKEPLPDPVYLKPQGQRIISDLAIFFSEPLNKGFSKPTVEKFGLNYKTFSERQRDALYTDLMGARFFMDKKNDGPKECNSNRIWLVTEKDGYQMALAHLAFESYRFASFKDDNLLAVQQNEKAIKNYAGIIALSPSENNPVATIEIRKMLVAGTPMGKEGIEHIRNRMAIVAVHGKSEGNGASMKIMREREVTGTEADLKAKFKYIKEYDNSKVKGTPTGIELFDSADTLGARKDLTDFLDAVVRKALVFGEQYNDKKTSSISIPPRHPIMISR